MNEQADELLDLLAPDLAQLLVDEDREAFVTRAIARFPNDDPGAIRSFAGALYRALPLPGRGFRQESQTKIGRNDACPCGSGRKYKQCCGEFPEPPLPAAEALLQLVLPHMNRDQWAHFSQHPDMPADYCADLAWHCMRTGHPKKAWEVIKPLADRLDSLRNEHQHAIALGLDALLDLGHDRKRAQLMEALCEHPHSASLRSVGHQRLAMVKMQRQLAAEAREHLEQARRNDPDQTELHLAELSVLPYLVSETELRERARFWQKRLKKRFGPDYPYRDMVDDIAERGRAAVEALTGQPVHSIDEAQAEEAEVVAGSGESSLNEALATLGVSSELLLAQQLADVLHQAMGQTRSALIPDEKDKTSLVVGYDRELIRLEREWIGAWFEHPLRSVIPAMEASDYEARWQQTMPAWMNWLITNPELLGSFLVLSELQRFLSHLPEAVFMDDSFDAEEQLLLPFAMHRLACVRALLAQNDNQRPLVEDLEVHANLIDCLHPTLEDLWVKGLRYAAPKLSEQTLYLLPTDPLGARFELAEHYAISRNHQGIDWLFQRYGKNDQFPEVTFARLLQLWQQGDTKAAQQHIKVLQRDFPKALKTLRRGDFEAAPLGEDVWAMNEGISEMLR